MIVRKIQRFIHPGKIIFLEGNAQRKYGFPWMNESLYLLNVYAINYYTEKTGDYLIHWVLKGFMLLQSNNVVNVTCN